MSYEGPKLRLGNLLASLSLALDFQESSQLEHHRRSAYIAVRLGEELHLGHDQLQAIFFAAMLHDIGTTEYSHPNDNKESEYQEHPVKGSEIIDSLPYLQESAKIVCHHHERIDGQGYPWGLTKEEIPIGSQLICIANAIEKVYSFSEHNLASPNSQRMMEHRLEIGAGSEFDPELIRLCQALFKQTKFWLDLNSRNLNRIIDRMASRFDQEITSSDLNQIGEVFAHLIDGKSPFTAFHSKDVAFLSVKISKELGLKGDDLLKIHTAGLLHDLGKIGVPNNILNKPGPLTQREMEIIKAHPYYTEQILFDVKGLEDVTLWASMHHEKLNGSGYHARRVQSEIPLQARIIAVADAFQAMVADRPYRKALSPEEAFQLLAAGIKDGYWDSDVVSALKSIS